MDSQKLVSVCINAYNSSQTIAQTLSSVLAQTYTNLQIVVVDDCSTDNTVEIVKSFDDKRIELYTLEKNGNVSIANNECLRHTKGEYIAHLDADDIWVPDKIEKQVNFLEENLQYGACFSHAGFIDEDSNEYLPDRPCPHPQELYVIENMSQARFIRFFYDNANRLCHCSMLMRRSVYQAIGEHDITIKYLHDFDYWVKMIQYCPIYVIQEKLVYCRIRSQSSSVMDENATNAHNEEMARVMYRLVDNCPNGLFSEAFSDLLKLSGEHTDDETEIEKAFVLANGFIVMKDNRILAIKKFEELFREKKFVELAEKKFGFTVNDLYALQKNEVYFNSAKELVLKNENSQLTDRVDALESQIAGRDKSLYELSAQLSAVNSQYASLSEEYSKMSSAFFFKFVKAERKLKNIFAKINHVRPKYTCDGKKVRARFVLYGYYGHNFGDDAFFDMLFRRYPDIMFYIVLEPSYAEFFSHYPNVRFYDNTRTLVQKVNNFGNKLKIRDLFEKLLIRITNGAIHIGGSIYQQVGDWELDCEMRKGRKQVFRHFFSISNNFGPYTTEEYKNLWENRFKKWDDVCFRDKYSYKLFSNVKTVRYAPDLLFAYPIENRPSEKKICVSVINPYLEGRRISKSDAENYEKTLTDTVKKYISDGYRISLLCFCNYEKDEETALRILSSLSQEEKDFVKCVSYTGNLKEITDEISDCETVVATRFHAMIFGYAAGKKVLPVCYGDKMTNVIEDLHLSDNYIKIGFDAETSVTDFYLRANTLDEVKIKKLSEDAQGQFAKLDKFAQKRGATVNR